MGTLDALLTRLKGQRVYINANFFIYFLNQQAPFFEVVAPTIQAADAGEFTALCGDAVVTEVMVHPYKMQSPSEIARTKTLFKREAFLTVVRHAEESFDLMAHLRATTNMRMLDALHYATAVNVGCRYLLTNDKDFKTTGTIEVIGISSLLSNS
jgi:predicted nucleic acid-binding protein